MVKSFEFAISHVTRDWMCLIGDDDALLPDALKKAAHIFTTTNLPAICTQTAIYYWPGIFQLEHGLLAISLQNSFEVRSTSKMIPNVMNGLSPYCELPMLYTGSFVQTSIVNSLKDLSPHCLFYHSMTPDVYSSLSISHIIDAYAYTTDIYAIAGLSGKSNGANYIQSDATKNLSSITKDFFSVPGIQSHPSLPLNSNSVPIQSMHFFVYETYLQLPASVKALSAYTADPTRQLQIILAKSRRFNRVETLQMVHAYCHLHSVSPSRIINPLVLLLRLRFRLSLAFSRLVTLGYRFHVGPSSSNDINNILDAVSLIGSIRALRPSPLLCFFSQIKRVFLMSSSSRAFISNVRQLR